MRANMRSERVRAGLTIEQAAERLGVHKNSVRRWETGESEPMAGALVDMAHLYGCTPEYLLGMTDDRSGTAVAR